MGDFFGGSDDVESTVTYEIPPEIRQLYQEIVNIIQGMRPLIEKATPDVQGAIQNYIQQYQDWLERSPEYFKQAQQELGSLADKTTQQLSNLFFGRNLSASNSLSERLRDLSATIWRESLRGMAPRIEPSEPKENRLEQMPIVIRTPVDDIIDAEISRREAAGDPDPIGSVIREYRDLGPEKFMEKYGKSLFNQGVNQGINQEINQGVMNLLNQYIQQAQGQIQQAWDEAISRAGGFWDEAISRAGGFWDEARRTLLQDIQEAEQKIPQYYEEAKKETRELTKEVLQDALRNTIRKMALQGLISQTAGTQAMAEQFRQYEYEPLQRLTEAKAEARRKLEEIALGYKTDVGEKKAGTLSSLAGQKAGTLSSLAGQKAGELSSLAGQEARALSSLASQGLQAREGFLRDYTSDMMKILQTSMLAQQNLTGQKLGFQLSLPEIYRAIMQAQQQYALTPFELNRLLLGAITGAAGTAQQLAPANVTQSTSGGINPILGGLIGTAGTLGLFKLFGLI
jgi:hypothetical protein